MVTLNLSPVIHLSSEDFQQLCFANPEIKLELTAQGALVIVSPTGGESGIRNTEIIYQLQAWNKQKKLGVVFDSSTMFQFPSGAFRSPDAAWIILTRWNILSRSEKETFPPIVPDFVIELRSVSDSLKELQNKMQEYIDNGVRLGWLINPQNKQVEIYRANSSKEILQNPSNLSGEKVLPGFVLELTEIM
jgi:Uma2 family endonuclease